VSDSESGVKRCPAEFRYWSSTLTRLSVSFNNFGSLLLSLLQNLLYLTVDNTMADIAPSPKLEPTSDDIPGGEAVCSLNFGVLYTLKRII